MRVCLRRGVGWLVFMGQVISYANKWEDYFNYLGRRERFPGIRPLPTFLAFCGQPWNLSVAPMSVSFSMLICYNKRTMKLKVCWNLNLLPSWPLVGFNQCLSHPQWSCHSFTDCALTPSLPSPVQAHSDCLQVKCLQD